MVFLEALLQDPVQSHLFYKYSPASAVCTLYYSDLCSLQWLVTGLRVWELQCPSLSPVESLALSKTKGAQTMYASARRPPFNADCLRAGEKAISFAARPPGPGNFSFFFFYFFSLSLSLSVSICSRLQLCEASESTLLMSSLLIVLRV